MKQFHNGIFHSILKNEIMNILGKLMELEKYTEEKT